MTPSTPEFPLTVVGHNGTVILDADSVTIHRSGHLAKFTLGEGDKRIPLSAVQAVQWKRSNRFETGHVRFTFGGPAEQSKDGKRDMDITNDENAVIFNRKAQAAFDVLRDALNEALSRAHAPQPPSLADELGKLADLRDRGVLTAEEFEAAKARLLGG